MTKPDVELFDLFQEALGAVLHQFQILHAQRSYTNEIMGFDVLFDNTSTTTQNGLTHLADYRLIYTLKKVLGNNHQGQWTNLQDRMLLPLTRDDVLVLPFDAHRHEPLPEQISMVLGFDGVGHVITESIAQRVINHALENLTAHHHPFAFGFINIDSYAAMISDLDETSQERISQFLLAAFQAKLDINDVISPLNENEFALILTCNQDINEVFPKLWELSNLSNTPLPIAEREITLQFSAGYVLVTDPFTTAKEILDEAISMMYKSKNNGKNGYSLSDPSQD